MDFILTLTSLVAASFARRGSRLTLAAGVVRVVLVVTVTLVEEEDEVVVVLLLPVLLESLVSPPLVCFPRCLTRMPMSM